MNDRFKRVNLVGIFVVLTVLHAALYYSLGNPNGLMLAVVAALVDTGVIAVVQDIVRHLRKETNK